MSESNSPNKKRVLGRGLAALLSEKETSEVNPSTFIGNTLDIPLEKIFPNPNQPRTSFNPNTLQELINSISAFGIIQPITLRKQINSYEIISGERRYQACKELGLKSIPAFIRIANDKEMLQMALVENLQREELNPIEIALCYKKLLEETNINQEELGLKLGKSRSSITNQIRLLKLPDSIQVDIQKGFISLGHGRALLALKNEKNQLDFHQKIIKTGLSVRQLENLIKNYEKKETEDIKPIFLDPYLTKVKKSFEEKFRFPIDIKQDKKGKGKILISFNNKEEFESIKNSLL